MVYLRDHPPVRSQFTAPRRAKPTGLTVIHTAESVLDTIGPDTGAEAVAAFVQRRTTPGSYHDLADSDTALQLVRYEDEAYQDGTGSNPYALSISFALRTSDWAKLTPERRRAFLRQGAKAFARQQAWLRSNGYPTTPLRWITREQSERGTAGFIRHSQRDPARRSDPGADFPADEFFDECGAALAGNYPTEEDDMAGEGPNILKFVATGGPSTKAPDGSLSQDVSSDSLFGRVVDIQWALTRALPVLLARAGEPMTVVLGDDQVAQLTKAIREANSDEDARQVLDGLWERLRPPTEPTT